MREGCGTQQSVSIKAPPHSLKNSCWVWCEQQLDFPRHTYLLLCEEDVSVTQLEKKKKMKCCYHLTPDSSPIQTINHFPPPAPNPRVSVSGGQMEDRRVSYRKTKALSDRKCSRMDVFFFGGGLGRRGSGWSLRTRYGWRELNSIKCTESQSSKGRHIQPLWNPPHVKTLNLADVEHLLR